MSPDPKLLPGTIVWIAPFYNRSGFGVGARTNVLALHKAGARIRIIPVNQVEAGIDDCDLALIKSLETTPVIPPVTAIISHVPSRSWLDIKFPEPNVRILATTVFDCSAKEGSPPAEMLAVCREMDQIWLHVEFEREAFIAAGFPPEMVHTVIWPHHWLENPSLPLLFPETSAANRPFRFLNISLFLPRRRWDSLIEAYLEEFKETENVELYLKVNYPSWHPVPGKPRQDLLDLVTTLRRKTGSGAAIIIDEDIGNRSGIVHLIDTCNAYISTDTALTAPVSEARVRQRMVIMPEGLIGMPAEWYVAISVNPHAKIPLTHEMLLYQPNHKGASMPLLHVQDVRDAMRRAYDMTPHERQTRAASAASILGPSEAVPKMVSAINAAWQYKEALERNTKPKKPAKRIAWEGSQLVRHSLALINRELCLRLIDSGYEVSIIPYEKDDISPDVDPRFEKIVQRTQKALSGKADVHVRHQWPPNFQPPREGYWVNVQPWEFGSLPEEWIRPMSTMMDEMWVPSSYVRECYIRSGVPGDRVFVVPNGVDTETFHPGAVPFALSTAKRFKFLFVGGTIFRKGIDILLDTYFNTFSEKDDVCLVIKDMGGRTFYKGQTAQQMIKGYKSRPGAPEIEYIEHTMNDKDMAGLYTACNCLVHPYRGEGFGLPIAEAMACGLPVVVTGYGAALDFCNSDNAYLIPACEVRLSEKRIGDIKTVGRPWLAEPDRAAVKAILKHVFENVEEAKIKARAGQAQIETKFTWEKAAEAVMQRFDALRQKPIRRFESPVQSAQSWVAGLTSIIVRASDDLDLLKKCFKSIKKHTNEPYEIVVVTNNSSRAVAKWVKETQRKYNKCKCIENTENLGFAIESNQGIRAASGEYLLLLDPDVVVTEHWLSGMLACLNSSVDIGIVGPMTNKISGPQKVPDVGYSTIDELAEYAQAFCLKNRHRRIPRRRVVGFCMLFQRRLIEKVGLLDESFGSGNFEDDDFCLRASLEGYCNLIAGDVFVHHYGSRPFIGNRIDYDSSLTGNKRIFSEKWSRKDLAQRYGKKLLIENAITIADECYRKGEIEKAAASLIEAIKIVPEDRSLYLKLAEMLIDGKQYDDALGILQSVPGGDKDKRQLALLACCEEGLGHNDKAQDYVARALAIDPLMVMALNIAGVLAYKKGEKETAEGLFKKAIESDPGFGESYTNLGSLRWSSGEHIEALNLFERGFILSPGIADVVTAYHSAIAETGSCERAETVFRDARALHPNDKRIAFFIIAVLIKQGKHDLAMREIEHAMIQFGIGDGILNAALEIRLKTGPLEIRPGSTRRSLSICMIVKNEELNLAKCLMSVKPVADEIIVVDTGSTDRTRAIAAALGAKVFDFTWMNSFSEARNYSLSKASGEWILVLDADEIISPLDHGKLKKLVKKANKRVAYSMVTRNYTNQAGARGWTENDGRYIQEEAGRGWFPSPKVRLFVNDKRINFVNPVHELVEPALEKIGIKIQTCDVPIQHYGRLNQDKLIAKGKEYYRLGIAKIEKAQEDYNALKELGIQAAEIGEYEEAVHIWKKVLDVKPQDPVAFMNMGYAYLMLEQYEKAKVFSKNALDIDPELREAALNYSASELIAGDVKMAISALENLLEKHPEYPPAFGRMAAACLLAGRKNEGLGYLDRLHKKGFDCANVLEEQARALHAQGKNEQAVMLLEVALEKRMANGRIHPLLTECRQKIKYSSCVTQ